MKTTRRRDGLAGQAFNNSAVTNLLIRIVVSLVCVSSSRGAINALRKPLMSLVETARLNIREKPTVALHNVTNSNRDNLTVESDNDGPPLFDKKAKQGFKTTAYR